ncbi:MAG: hypothetical protein AB1758_30570 [Candidatus Eremiobacterota bacterium]
MSMKVDFAFLCDHADATNKIFGSGIGIDTILARSVPVRHPQLFVVVQVRAPVEVTQKGLTIRLVDGKANPLINQVGQLRFSRPLYGNMGLARFAMGFYSLEFGQFGEYVFEVLVEGEEPIRLPFHLVQVSSVVRPPEPPAAPEVESLGA